MNIQAFPNGIFEAITYLVFDEESKEAMIIDATSSVDEIEKIVNEKGLNLKYILLTHGHFDHIYKLDEFKKRFPNALVMINRNDIPLVENVKSQCQMAQIEEIEPPAIENFVDENTDNLTLGSYKIKVIETKGHSKGGNCYLIDDLLFSGDTLFRNSIGRYDLFGGSYEELEDSIKNKLFKLDENIRALPGHGESTIIGYEKKYNPYFQA